MPQEFSELATEYQRIAGLARERKWVPPATAPIELRITSTDSPDDVHLDPLRSLVHRLAKLAGVSLYLNGGGYGCFDLGLTSASGSADAVTRAITEDAAVQATLNRMRAHEVSVRANGASHSFRAYNDLTFVIGTNRRLAVSHLPKGAQPRGLFGDDASPHVTYALTDVSISDMSERQPDESLLKRAWRSFTRKLGQRREHDIIIRRLDLYDDGVDDLKSAVAPHVGRGMVVLVHGYANTFDAALDGFALAVHRARLADLQLLPVMFSWPAAGNPVLYTKDTNTAENSELQLLEVLDLACDMADSGPVSVLAHSHGNKILVRALTSRKKGRIEKSRWLQRIVFVEPDVDQQFLASRADVLADSAEQMVLYHSRNDRALWFAEFLFDSVRAGREGLVREELDAEAAKRLEIVDATDVSAGLTRHAPHLESAEVIADLHHVFRGEPAHQRFGLRRVSAARWSLHSPTAR